MMRGRRHVNAGFSSGLVRAWFGDDGGRRCRDNAVVVGGGVWCRRRQEAGILMGDSLRAV